MSPGAYELSERRNERPTLHYSVERHLNLNGCNTSLIWTYFQVGRKCCFYSQRAPHVCTIPYMYSDGANSK